MNATTIGGFLDVNTLLPKAVSTKSEYIQWPLDKLPFIRNILNPILFSVTKQIFKKEYIYILVKSSYIIVN